MRKSLKTIIINRRYLLVVFFVCLLVLASVCVPRMVAAHTPRPEYVIVVDAGHGGRDYGCQGLQGTKESEINLAIAKYLKTYLNTLGVKVVMTREDANGLYAADANNFKVSDMEARIKIIENSSPNMVISIHQNSFSDHTQYGAQVFYQDGCETSIEFAGSVQKQLGSILGSERVTSPGDYYLLKECGLPSVIVECGYLSNAEEELKLNNIDYQKRVAYAIMCGVVDYLNVCGSCYHMTNT